MGTYEGDDKVFWLLVIASTLFLGLLAVLQLSGWG